MRTRANYGVAGPVQTITSGTGGVYSADDQRYAKLAGTWPTAYITSGLRQYFDAYIGTTTSSTWTDIQGYGNLTFTNSPTVSTGAAASNYFVTLNGTNQYGSGLGSTNLASFTIYTWIKTTTTSDSGTFWQKPPICGYASVGAGSRDFGLTIGGGYAGIWTGLASGSDQTNQPSTAAADINDGNWFEIAVTSSFANGTKLFVNQTQIGTALTVNQNTDASNGWRLGGLYGEATVYTNFSCAVFMLYTSELTTSQLATNWNWFRGRYGR